MSTIYLYPNKIPHFVNLSQLDKGGDFSYSWSHWLNNPNEITPSERHEVVRHPTGARIEAIITWMNTCAIAHR